MERAEAEKEAAETEVAGTVAVGMERAEVERVAEVRVVGETGRAAAVTEAVAVRVEEVANRGHLKVYTVVEMV